MSQSEYASAHRKARCGIAACLLAIALAFIGVPPAPLSIAGAQETDTLAAGNDASAILADIPRQNIAPPFFESGMASVGAAKVVGITVDFPNYTLDAGDDAHALSNIINAAADAANPYYPYESLHAYYQRASYGRLNICGDTFSYTAAHEREYYDSNVEGLFHEAVAALDASVDFSQYDANDDGCVDAVFLRFAGPTTGWNTTWWSKSMQADTETLYDGKRLFNIVPLHLPSNTADAARTIIHETGHVLGAPDLYCYLNHSPEMGVTSRGTCTWDPMDNTAGDINGYFKWLFGWIDESDIVRVTANDQGVVVKKGGTVLQTIAPTIDDQGKASAFATLDLSAFDSNVLEECGGFIIVSNTDASTDQATLQGRFANFYLIQYEQAAGNQTVQWYRTSDGTTHSIPSGFRIFRVQAEVSSSGYFIHVNTEGKLHDVLIEALDMDEGKEHPITTQGMAPAATTAQTYDCLLQPGFVVDATSTPSSNFLEDSRWGFTGLSFEALSCNSSGGTIRIGYSDAEKPQPREFTLSCAQPWMLNHSHLTFETPWRVSQNYDVPSYRAVQVLIGDESYPAQASVTDRAVTVDVSIPPTAIKPGDVCRIVFAERMMIIGKDDTGNVYSPEITCELPIGPAAPIAGDEVIEAFDSTFIGAYYSSAAYFDGNAYLLWAANDKAFLTRIDNADIHASATMEIAGLGLPREGLLQRSAGTLNVYDSQHAVLCSQLSGSLRLSWIDLTAGSVSACIDIPPVMGNCVVDSAGRVYALYYDEAGNRQLGRFAVQPDGQVAKDAVTQFAAGRPNSLMAGSITADGEALALLDIVVQGGQSESTHCFAAFTEDQLEEMFANAAVDSESASGAYAAVSIHLGDFGQVSEALLLPDKSLCLLGDFYIQNPESPANRDFVQAICHYANNGEQLAFAKLTSPNRLPNTRFNELRFSGRDGLSVTSISTGADYSNAQETLLVKLSDLDICGAENARCLATNTSYSRVGGYWIPNDSWMGLELTINEETSRSQMHAYRTDLSQQPDPTPASDPYSGTPSTGDGSFAVVRSALLLAVLALCGIAVSAIFARMGSGRNPYNESER